MLTPADINNKEFGTTRLREGYDQKEVDDFLDDVAAQLQVVTARLAAAEDRVKTLERVAGNAPTTVIPPVPAEPPTASAAGILAMAQETADKHVAEARSAAQVVADKAQVAARAVADAAVQEANRLKGEALAEAQKLKVEGLAEKQRALDDLEARHGQVAAAVDRLLTEGTKIREALNQALTHYESQVHPT